MGSFKRLNEDDMKFVEMFYEENYKYLYIIAGMIEKDEEIIKESIQDTFLTASLKLRTLRNRNDKRKWLVYTMKNKIKKNRRKNIYTKNISGGITIYSLPNDDILKIAEKIGISDTYFFESTYEELKDKFNEILSDKEIEYLIYKYADGYSNKELSLIFNISYAKVCKMGYHIRNKVRKFLNK